MSLIQKGNSPPRARMPGHSTEVRIISPPPFLSVIVCKKIDLGLLRGNEGHEHIWTALGSCQSKKQ